MHMELFHEWVRQIYTTRDNELDCDGFFESVPQFVDMEITKENTNPRFSEIEHHLNQCPHCHDLYLTLRDAALLESQLVIFEPMVPHSDDLIQGIDNAPSIGGVPLVL
ncbi:MAG: hypothetical protein GY847_32995 [Proteobacteria bacterium]|nr:hypothetical protein [Pseudomonadota bacterium]